MRKLLTILQEMGIKLWNLAIKINFGNGYSMVVSILENYETFTPYTMLLAFSGDKCAKKGEI